MVPLRVRWRERAADCDDLVWRQGFPAPWEGRWWYEALEQGALEDQFRFLYAEVVDDAGRVLAIAPAFLMDVPLEMFVPDPLVPLVRAVARLYPALLHQRTLFYGSPCSERGWVGCAADLPPASAAPLLEALDRALYAKAREVDAAMQVWKDLPDAWSGQLQSLAHQRGLFRAVSFPGTTTELPAGGKDAWFQSLKPSRRQTLRRKLRQASRAAGLQREVVEQPEPALLDQLFALFWQTYERATTRFERLNRQVFGHIAAASTVAIIVLREPDQREPVAFMLMYCDGPVLVNKFVGFDYSRPREWLLYFQLWDAALDYALACGKRAIESGQTGYRAKIAVGHRMFALTNWCRHRNPLLHAVYRAVARRVDWASLDPELALADAVDDPAAESAPNHGNP